MLLVMHQVSIVFLRDFACSIIIPLVLVAYDSIYLPLSSEILSKIHLVCCVCK